MHGAPDSTSGGALRFSGMQQTGANSCLLLLFPLTYTLERQDSPQGPDVAERRQHRCDCLTDLLVDQAQIPCALKLAESSDAQRQIHAEV